MLVRPHDPDRAVSDATQGQTAYIRTAGIRGALDPPSTPADAGNIAIEAHLRPLGHTTFPPLLFRQPRLLTLSHV